MQNTLRISIASSTDGKLNGVGIERKSEAKNIARMVHIRVGIPRISGPIRGMVLKEKKNKFFSF